MRATLILALFGCLVLETSAQTVPPSAAGSPARARSGPAKIPSTWFDKAKGYDKALALQRETGADVFVYFSRQAPENEKGLCQWFENKGLNAPKVKDYLRGYIKVTVPLPSNPDCQKLAEEFEVRKCPAVFIVQTNGWRNYCKVFDWPGGRPKLFAPDELIQFFRARSGPSYQLPEDTGEPAPP